MTTHLQLVTRSRKCGSKHPLPHTPSCVVLNYLSTGTLPLMYTIEKKSLCRYGNVQRMVDESLPEVIMNWLSMGRGKWEPWSRWPCRSSRGFPPRRPGFEPRPGHVGFVVGKMAVGQFFSEYFGFPCQFSFHRLLQIHHHLSSGAGTIGQLLADVPSGLSLIPPQETKLHLQIWQ
jgi:hypothetical protein